jgi:hypothetical protein
VINFQYPTASTQTSPCERLSSPINFIHLKFYSNRYFFHYLLYPSFTIILSFSFFVSIGLMRSLFRKARRVDVDSCYGIFFLLDRRCFFLYDEAQFRSLIVTKTNLDDPMQPTWHAPPIQGCHEACFFLSHSCWIRILSIYPFLSV